MTIRYPAKKTIAVYELMKSGKPVPFADILKIVGPNEVTAMTHICALRNLFGGEIDTIREGRKVQAYQLNNAADVAKYMVVKNSGAVAKTPKAKVVKQKPVQAAKVAVAKTKTVVARSKPKADAFDIPTLDSDLDISEVTDRELDDLKMQLGL